VTRWPAVTAPVRVEGRAPATGRLEPALHWLAGCQGAWPPRHPTQPAVVAACRDTGSLASGAARADDVIDRGADLLVVHGGGSASQPLVVLAALLDVEPVQAVGTASGGDWPRLVVEVRDGLRTARAHRADPEALLDALAADVVAGLAGALAQAATRRTATVLDGSTAVAAAALCAARLAPGAHPWWLAGSVPPNPAARRAHEELGLASLLDLDLDGPDGADLAVTVLERGIDLAHRG
jgi:nicotinate-nucleotide--dimethylbenzimidazole phosphoribosyltransferase